MIGAHTSRHRPVSSGQSISFVHALLRLACRFSMYHSHRPRNIPCVLGRHLDVHFRIHSNRNEKHNYRDELKTRLVTGAHRLVNNECSHISAIVGGSVTVEFVRAQIQTNTHSYTKPPVRSNETEHTLHTKRHSTPRRPSATHRQHSYAHVI